TILRGIEGAKWSKTLRAWYLKYSPTNETVIHEAFSGIAQLDTSRLFDRAAEKPAAFPVKRDRTLGPEQRQLLNGFYKYLVGKRYSKSTIDTYLCFVADFIEFQSGRDLTTLTGRDVELFIE